MKPIKVDEMFIWPGEALEDLREMANQLDFSPEDRSTIMLHGTRILDAADAIVKLFGGTEHNQRDISAKILISLTTRISVEVDFYTDKVYGKS